MEKVYKFFQKAGFEEDFRIVANFGCACAALLFLTPFAVNNLLHDRLMLGFTSLGIVIVTALNAWSIIAGKFRPLYVFLVLVPFILVTLVLATQNLGIIGIVWSYPAILAFYFMLTERQAWSANIILLMVILPLGWYILDDFIAIRVSVSLILVSAFSAVFIRVISYQQSRLIEAKHKAEAANRAKSEFIANMSHEIRTPLNAVIGFSILLQKTEVNAKQKSYLESIYSGGKTLLSLINDILDLSKIEADKLILEPRPVLIRPVFEDICQIFAPRAKDKGLTIKLDFDDNVPNCMILDETRIRQVLFNLVGNAIKFTHQGYIKIMVTTESDIDDNNNKKIKIDIKDTGIGIHKDQQQKIFGSFDQHEGQSNRQYGGTGLGLSICRKLVDMMDGKIILDSETGQGATFTIYLNNISDCEPEAVDAQLSRDFSSQEVFDFDDNYRSTESLEINLGNNDKAMDEINSVVMPLWYKAKKSGIFDDALLFSSAISDIGQKYQIKGMIVLSERVKVAVENFEITELENAFKEFKQKMQHWKEQNND